MMRDPSIHDLLKSRFGFARFLPLQDEVIRNILVGKDWLVPMPVDASKSLCFEGLALVASARQQV